MLKTNLIQVTGRGTNVNFAIDDTAPFGEVAQGLREHLAEHRALYSRGSITVNVGRRMLAREELTQIKQILEKESGVAVARFWCSPGILEEALSETIGFGVAVSPSGAPVQPQKSPESREDRKASPAARPEPDGLDLWQAYSPPAPAAHDSSESDHARFPVRPGPGEEVSPPASSGHSSPEARQEKAGQRPASPASYARSEVEVSGLNRGNEALLIKTTCRSGEVIRYPGDVIVLADVNPGAQIIADGDIMVFGNLRGLAHAGASGDVQATIIALNLDTHRLQIGPYTGMAPKANKRSKSTRTSPQIVYVRRRSIFVAPYAGRFAGYSGGILYDG
jgi:septum site-determining protein MinC